MQMNGSYSFVYDIDADVPAVIEEVTPSGTVRYFRTPDGVLIARLKGSEWRFYHYDELGSTRLLTDGSGSVTDRYSYDAYGSVTSHIGSTTDNPYQYVGALGYYTHYQDPDFRLLELGFRFYDTESGRFTQLDPVGDGINWYAYAGGNPTAWVDPWGLWLGGDLWRGFVRWFGGQEGDLTDRILHGATDFSAGMGDTISLGGTKWLRERMGTDEYVQYGSGWHTAGRIGGYAWWGATGTWGAVRGYPYLVTGAQKAVGYGIAAYQGVRSSVYMIGSWNIGELLAGAEVAGAAVLSLPQWAYSWGANQLWLWLVYMRPGTTILFGSDPTRATRTFLREVQCLTGWGFPW